MPDLLLELFSEEIPARMQAKAAEDLRRMVTDKLVAEGLVYEGAKAFVTPRRLALTVHGIPARQPDLKDERKGPRVGGPDAAVQGFLKATGLASLDEAKIQRDPKKGDFYVALIEKPGRPAIEVLADILPVIVRTFPWPKQMRWGAASAKPGALTWVRPLHSIVATFGIDTEEPEIVPFEVAGIRAGNTTSGHRFLAPAALTVRRFDDYDAKLHDARVVLDVARRRDIILADAKTLAQARGLDLVEDQGLLDEVAGLVEWPVVLMGSFDESFLTIPGEVIRATIRNNQKCFVVSCNSGSALPPPLWAATSEARAERVGEGGEPQAQSSSLPPPPTPPRKGEGSSQQVTLAPHFVLTSNIEASDGGAAIVAGNERVIRARLSDAKFFYETDLKTKLEDRLPKFDQIVFHEKLGTQAERIQRIEKLAAEIAPLVGSDVEKAKRAARLCKADLLTEVVGEFPELQGTMGKYYALAQGEDASVAAACEDHYKPQGPSDRVPTDPVSVAVALADKVDTLVGFWAIDEKPTGSKDPYALRRAALGVIRIILETQARLRLSDLIGIAFRTFLIEPWKQNRLYELESLSHIVPEGFNDDGEPAEASFPDIDSDTSYGLIKREFGPLKFEEGKKSRYEFVDNWSEFFAILSPLNIVESSLLSFFADRLKAQLREQGARHDLVDAVFAANAGALPPPLRGRVGEGGEPQAQSSEQPPAPTPPRKGEGSQAAAQDDLVLIVRRVDALAKFLDTDDGKNLLAGTKRAANILRIEEKKDARAFDGDVDASLLKLPEEKALADAVAQASREAAAAVATEDFAAAMSAMAKLRAPVDAFFEAAKVNDDDAAVRENRLRLLNAIRATTSVVADFSRIVN